VTAIENSGVHGVLHLKTGTTEPAASISNFSRPPSSLDLPGVIDGELVEYVARPTMPTENRQVAVCARDTCGHRHDSSASSQQDATGARPRLRR